MLPGPGCRRRPLLEQRRNPGCGRLRRYCPFGGARPPAPAELQDHPAVVAADDVGASRLVRYFPPVDLHERLPEDFDILEDPHYTMAAPEENPSGEHAPGSEPYLDPAGQGLMVTVASPIYDEGGRYTGTIGLDVALDQLVVQVDQTRPSDNGFAFAIGKDGNLLPGSSAPLVEDALSDPDNVAIGRVLAAMRAGQSGTERLSLGGQDVVVGYAPLGDLGGSLALVSPVEDIAEEAGVAAVTQTINEDAERTLVFVGLVTVLLFGVAVVVAAWLNRRFIASPVSSLLGATRAVAAGNLSVSIPVTRQDELGDLAAVLFSRPDPSARRPRDRAARGDARARARPAGAPGPLRRHVRSRHRP
ncbi:MAG: cache domain-containing protein [Dehalococcoidia bacterium]|nr:cache domain-containing protein [Dehalococcoidia bacterium]